MYLVWYHRILLALATFGILYGIYPAEKTDDLNILFERKMKSLIIIWASILFIIFTFIPFNLYLLLISILIVGTVTLPYIMYKEKQDEISVKYRFYTTLFLIITFIVTFVLLALLFTEILVLV